MFAVVPVLPLPVVEMFSRLARSSLQQGVSGRRLISTSQSRRSDALFVVSRPLEYWGFQEFDNQYASIEIPTTITPRYAFSSQPKMSDTKMDHRSRSNSIPRTRSELKRLSPSTLLNTRKPLSSLYLILLSVKIRVGRASVS